MARWITCDEVFDALTQGPFPQGDDETDAAVELHLAGCHECRQLAEGLRPAVELLQEALVDGDESLPAYRGSLPRLTSPNLVLDYSRTASQASSEIAPKGSTTHTLTRPDPKSIWIANGVRVAAACLLILLMISVIPLIAVMRGAPSPSQLRSQLSVAPLPGICRVAFQATDPTAMAEGCCARCHHPTPTTHTSDQTNSEEGAFSLVKDASSHRVAAPQLAQGSLQLVAKSCQACHQ